MKNIVDLRGKRIFVTGASSGIGRACAVMAAELGARVILNGRREDALAETLRMCPGDGHTSVAGDITDESFVAGLAESTGPIDGLVHAAGVCSICPLGVVPRAQLEAAVKTNYYAFVELVKCYSRGQFHGDGFSAVAVSVKDRHESIDITYRYAHLFPTRQTDMVQQLELKRAEGGF